LIASQEELLTSPEAFREGQGGLISLALGSPAAFGGSSDPVFIANGFAEISGLTAESVVVEQPTTNITVNGQPAASATYRVESSGFPMQVRIAVVANGDRIITILAATPKSAETVIGPLIDSTINSIVISPEE
jgi:predicted Zn-dependent protease